MFTILFPLCLCACLCETFECSGHNSPNSCHFWNSKSVFLQILHHSSGSWDITPLYFFSWNFIYFQQKKPIKVQIWWNFRWAVEILHFDGLLLFKSCTVSAKKKYRRVTLMTLKNDVKNKEKLACSFKYDIRNLVNFHPTIQKFENCLLSKV